MSATAIPTGIPSMDSITVLGGGLATWRFSKGKIVTGRDTDGTLKSRENVVGVVRRIGVHEARTKDFDQPYAQVECDVETADGLVAVKAGLLNQETKLLGVVRSTVDFAYGLTKTPVGGLIMITTGQGEAWVQTEGPKRGQTMAPSTYVNFFLLTPDPKNEGKFLATPLRRPKADPNAAKVPMNDQWLALERELRLREDFAPRPDNRQDEEEEGEVGAGSAPTAFAQISGLMAEREWPMPEEAPTEWLEMLRRLLKLDRPMAALSEHSAADYAAVLEAIRGVGTIPALLAPVKERLDAEKAKREAAKAAVGTGAVGTAEYDPFA